MQLAGSIIFWKRQWYQGVTRGSGGRRMPSRSTAARLSLAALSWLALACALAPASAQQTSNQPGFDPRQTERQFDAQQSEQSRASRSAVRLPRFDRSEARADSSKLIELQAVSVAGADAIPREQIARIYQPFLGKKVSQSDLAAIAAAITDLYRAAGYHLSRAIVPPQDVAAGRVRVEVIEGRISEVALKGEGAEQFGVRPMLNAVLAERPSRLATLERQLLLVNDRQGVRIADTALEEIGVATGNFRLIVYMKAWRIYT
jgi:hemolysin activation/secretion protein